MEKGKEKLIKFMTDKEVFTELIQNAVDGCARHWAELIADHLIANGVTFAKDTNVPSKWISVEDEKPKRRGAYFVAYKFGDSDMQFFGREFWHDDIPDNGYVQGSHFSNEGVYGMRVTHWMHIPELPMPKPPLDTTKQEGDL